MVINKHGGLNLTVTIQDEGWNKLATYRWNTGDKKRHQQILRTMEDAFGVKFKPRTDIDWM